ncbi:MAG TPA: hypothetical protein DCQ12_04840 [Candidatus Cloacimonas sp.]|jgi:hypothetical protein|nr:hypothetical protein [Candidatus Cloacimonas sp.]
MQALKRTTEPKDKIEADMKKEDREKAKATKGRPVYRNGKVRFLRNVLPIIMLMLFGLMSLPLFAQMDVSVSIGANYSDNVFRLSDYDLQRFEDRHPNLEYARTTDDLSIKTKVDMAYAFRYKWYKIEPSITASFSQNVSNTEKWRKDVLARLAVVRYYWDAKLLYGYYPNIYVRDYVDTDGSGKLEQFSYERNLYRADLNVRPLKKTTLKANFRYEELFYNSYWTEYDGDAKTMGLGLRQNFPVFVLDAMYEYRIFDNWDKYPEDSSYESNIYSGTLRLKDSPLNSSKKDSPQWSPSLSLSFEERFYGGTDPQNARRIDKIYTTKAGLRFKISKQLNFTLDYSHYLRNIDSPNASVRRLKPYSENQIEAMIKYNL